MKEIAKGWVFGLALASYAALPACSAEPAATDSPENDKAAAQAILDDLRSPDAPVASYPSSLSQVSTWNIHAGSTVAVVGVDDAGVIRAALALDADAQPRWCVRAAIDAGCKEIAAAMAKDLAAGGNDDLGVRTIHPLFEVPDGATCSETLDHTADWFAEHYPQESQEPVLVNCTEFVRGDQAPNCATVYKDSTMHTNLTGKDIVSKCCGALPTVAQGMAAGVTLVKQHPVPILCNR